MCLTLRHTSEGETKTPMRSDYLHVGRRHRDRIVTSAAAHAACTKGDYFKIALMLHTLHFRSLVETRLFRKF
jgi:hypothetical protein